MAVIVSKIVDGGCYVNNGDGTYTLVEGSRTLDQAPVIEEAVKTTKKKSEVTDAPSN
jgi:hypothetical protein